MYLQIIVGLSVLTICSGDSPKEAVSSVTYHRDDVPLSYKFSAVHAYSPQKPSIGQSNLNNYKMVQYAPIEPQVKEKPANLYTEAIFSKYPETKTSSNDKILEPQNHNFGNPNSKREFITGYNIETNPNRNNLNIDYRNDAFVHQKQPKLIMGTNSEHIELLKSTKLSQLNNLHIYNVKQQQESPYKTLQVLTMMENSKTHPVFNSLVKIPHLHLNVARSYNLAHQPYKAPVNEYQSNVENFQHSFLPSNDNTLLQKTLLYPIVKSV